MLELLRRILRPAHVRRFDAAAGGKRWQNASTFGPINGEIGAAARLVRGRAAHHVRNNPYLANGTANLVTGLVGPGIKPQSAHPDPAVRPDLNRRWSRWTETADADGVTDAYGLQALAVRSLIESGECLAHLLPGRDGLRIKLLDADMLPMDETRELGGDRRIIQGIELDADGTRVAYHIRRHRPDVPQFSTELVRVPADRIAHLFVPLVPGQMRGISWLAPVLLRLHELDQAEDAQLLRQKISAMFAGFLVDPTGSARGFSGSVEGGLMSSGLELDTMKVLPPGWDIRFSEPAAVGDSVTFMQLQLQSIAAGLGVPEWLLTGDMSKANYSSLRAALVQFRQRLEQLQYSIIVFQLCRPIWRAWIVNEYLAGRITGELDDLLAVEWITPAQPWVDPQKDAEAAILMVKSGFASRRQVVASLGWDIEALDAEIAADRQREAKLGLDFNMEGTTDAGRAADPAS